MPAPDLATIFTVAPAVEAAWKSVLTTYGATAFIQREDSSLTDLRIDVQCTLGEATGHRHVGNDGLMYLDAWAFRLTLGIVTPRKINNIEQEGLHAGYRSNVRRLAQYASDQFGTGVLPYHTLTQIQEAGTTPSIVSGDDCDVSEIAFSGVVSVRSDAWPTV